MAPLDWKRAFPIQALSDYRMYKSLLEAPAVERCHRLHYLQMATEKLSKAFLSHGSSLPRTSHARFAKFIQHAPNLPSLLKLFGVENQPAAFLAVTNKVTPVALEIESLAPEKQALRPNPEYPWAQRDKSGDVKMFVPCEFRFDHYDPRHRPELANILRFVEGCFQFLQTELERGNFASMG